MKTLFIIALFVLTSTTIYAQKKEIDANKSILNWNGKKVTGEHYGTIGLKNGQLHYKDKELLKATLIVDMATITCTDIENEEYNKKLVAHLKSDDFFGVKTYPTSTLVINSFSKKGEVYIAKGKLTIKDISNPVEFAVNIKNDELSGKLIIDRSLYNVRYGSGKYFDNLGDKMIYDDFELDFKIILQ